MSCDGDTPASAPRSSAAPAESQHAPAGDPSTLPKVAADADRISAMLRERFGDAVARNVHVEVEDRGGGKRVGLTGEVPNEEIRQAVMKEVETRVEGVTLQDFTLDLPGPVPMLFGFNANVRPGQSAVFSPDLSLAVSQKGDVYETATGRRINRMALPENRQVLSIVFAPDGKTLATGFRDAGILLWQMPLGRNPKTLQPFAEPASSRGIVAIAFTSDGKGLVSIDKQRGEIYLWDLARGAARTIGAHTPNAAPHELSEQYVLAVSPDGKTIASANADETAVSLWDVASRSRKSQLSAERLHPEALAWSHDGKTIAAGRATGDRRGVVVYTLDGKPPKILSLPQDALIDAMAFSPDDRTLAVEYQNKGVVLWDLSAGDPWVTLDYNKTSSGKGVAFSPDGAVLATECDILRPPGIRLWDVSHRPGATASTAALPRTHTDQTTEDDRLADEVTRKIRGTFDSRNIESLNVTIRPDGSVSLTGKVSDAEVKRVAGRTAEVYHVSEDIGPRAPNKVTNDLEVTGRYTR
jgi:WD40 repeat protein